MFALLGSDYRLSQGSFSGNIKPMADYESLAHLPRWRRLVIWLCENPVGLALWGWPAILAAIAPAYWLGLWWIVVVIVAGVSFALGWGAARRKLIRDGYLPKL